jgi:HD-GYP domain-containing protein (c-di-GMP phosphodiesterase class II)
MGDQATLMTAPMATATPATKVLNPAQQRQLEKFGRRINRLGANFAICSEDGHLLVLCEEGGFKSSRKRLEELARQVVEGQPIDPTGPVSILKFGGPNVALAGLLDLMVPGQAHFKGRAVALVDLGEDGAQAGPDRWSSSGPPVDLPHRRIYLSEMLASLIECFQGVARAEQQMELVGSELSHVYEELVLLHKLSTHMKLTESDGGFLQMVCDSLTEVSPVEGIAILLDRTINGDREVAVVAGSGLIDWDEPTAEALVNRLDREIREGKEALLDSDVFNVFKYEWPATIRNLIAVPLFGKGTISGESKETGNSTAGSPLDRGTPILGVMVAINSLAKRDFDSTDVKLFNSVANGCAVFIENGRLFGDIKDLFLGLLRALARSIDAKDGYTHGHSERVAFVARWIAERLVQRKILRPEQIHEAYFAGLLHDIGKIGIDDWVLHKTGPLTELERECIQKHPVIGAGILRGIKQMRDIVPAVLSHHERIDGTGYPNGLRGEQIPLIARIVGLADSFDAMTSRRSYRDAKTIGQAIEEIQRHSGAQFDADVARAFLDGDVPRLWEILQDGGSDVYYTGDVTDYATVAVGSLIR